MKTEVVFIPPKVPKPKQQDQSNELATLLRRLRKTAHLTQDELAKSTNGKVSRASLAMMESGNQNVIFSKFEAITDALGYEVIIKVQPKETS